MNEFHPVEDTVNVTLWKNGDTISVPIDTADALRKDGWLADSPETLPDLVNEIKVLADQVGKNIEQFVSAVTSDGVIDPHDGAIYAASLKSRSLLDQKIHSLITLVHSVYPMKQGRTASMTDEFGNAHEVDPNQVEEFLARGWSTRD